jgi:hypothetical protein
LATGWRAEIAGQEIRALVEGRISLASLPEPPFLVILPR